jgi:hypothetical protein
MHPTVIAMIAEERQAELRRAALSPRSAARSYAVRRPARGSGARLARLRSQLATLVFPESGTRASHAPTRAQACCA